MALNATQEIVEHQFDDYHKKNYPKLDRGAAFLRFGVQLALKNFKLDQGEIEKSIVDGKYDGGIDSFHIVLNRTESITPDTPGLSTNKPTGSMQDGAPLDVVVVQSKSGTSWDHDAIWKLNESLKKILRSSVSLKQLSEIPLNEAVVGQANSLRRIEKKTVLRNPRRTFTVMLMANAPEGSIHKHLENSRDALKETLKEGLPYDTEVVVELVGAEGIDQMIRQEPEFDGLLTFTKAPIRETRGTSRAFLGLVEIDEYLKFLRRDDSNILQDELFTVNVRDFAGPNTPVNRAIRTTLSEDSSTAFWWMNNGITVLADEASEPMNESWLLKNPQIVNGLQTSQVIHEADLENLMTEDRRKETLLVRIVTEKDSSIRESIITGTHNQTTVRSLQLYANDEVQHRIEAYLLSKGWYYERRKWQYRNKSVPASRIRGMNELAQAVIAVHLLRPDTARARPGTLLGTDAGYKSVFSEDAPDRLYSKSLDLMASIEDYLRTAEAESISTDNTNDRFYLASGYVVLSLGIKDLASFSAWKSIGNLRADAPKKELAVVHKTLYSVVKKTRDSKSKDSQFKTSDLRNKFLAKLVNVNKKKP